MTQLSDAPVISTSSAGSPVNPVTPAGTRTTVDPRLVATLASRVAVKGQGGETVTITSPLTGAVVGTLPICTADDIPGVFARAREAQVGWAALSFKQRAAVLLRFHDLLLRRQSEGLDLIQLESGKVRKHAFEEILDAAIVARYYARAAKSHLKSHRRLGALPGLTSATELHHPRGVVAVIAPWNYPLSMAITDALAALMAGNAVVIKPDSSTPFTALWSAQLLAEAGMPDGVVQIVNGPGRALGTPMIEQADYICFTGSTKTGRTIAKQAGENLIGCSLELGGKNPMLVLPDADLDKTVDGALRACFSSAGQLCISIERLYVADAIWDAFVPRFVERVRQLKLSTALDYSGEMGSLVSRQQFDTVVDHVEQAKAAGATVLAGGRARPDLGPYFYEPTVLTDVTPDMTLCTQETFGPVVSLYRFTDVEEAVALANASEYGLNCSIWSRDVRAARAIGARIKTGTVNINEAYAAAWASVDAPMGGMKASGLARRHGREGIVKYTEAQTIAAQRFLPIDTPPGMRVETYTKVMGGALSLLRRIPGAR